VWGVCVCVRTHVSMCMCVCVCVCKREGGLSLISFFSDPCVFYYFLFNCHVWFMPFWFLATFSGTQLGHKSRTTYNVFNVVKIHMYSKTDINCWNALEWKFNNSSFSDPHIPTLYRCSYKFFYCISGCVLYSWSWPFLWAVNMSKLDRVIIHNEFQTFTYMCTEYIYVCQ